MIAFTGPVRQLDTEPTSPAAFQDLIKSDHARWAKVVQAAGLRVK